MNWITKLYRKTGWHDVFNFSQEAAAARINIMLGGVCVNVVSALAEETFFTGFLLCYGINIVNISILTAIPLITSVFSLLTPRLLARIRKRKAVLSVSRMLYYVIRIVGITILPQVIHSDTGRVWGLIGITFVSSAVNFTFFSGFAAWHMPYITSEVRAPYFAATNILGTIAASVIPLLLSPWIDSLQGQARLNAFIFLRVTALAAAALDVFFYSRPREPVYTETSTHSSMLDVFRIPLRNRRFLLTMAIYAFYAIAVNIAVPLQNAWALDVVHTGYSYVSLIAFLYIPCAILTQGKWSRLHRRKGTFWLLSCTLLLVAPLRILLAFVDHGNYAWLMTVDRCLTHCAWIGMIVSAENLIYVNLPGEDRTCYLSFYTLLANIASFSGRMLGTGVVALIGEGTVGIGRLRFGAVPAAMVLEGLAMALVAVFIMLVRKKVEPAPLQKQGR